MARRKEEERSDDTRRESISNNIHLRWSKDRVCFDLLQGFSID